MNVRLSTSRILLTVVAALSHCREGLRDNVIHMPKSFSESVIVNSTVDPKFSIVYMVPGLLPKCITLHLLKFRFNN